MTKELPSIPVIQDDDLLHAVSSLVNAAESYRKAFLMVFSQSPKTEQLEDFIANHGGHLESCEEVILHWVKQLDLEDGLIPLMPRIRS